MITTDQTLNYTKDLNILYAEDDLELQAQTKEFFDVLFNSVTVVNDGEQALTKYKECSFDIVVSDIKMPIMDGIELTKKIKKLNHNQPIIIISAYSDNDYLLDFINLNIRYFIQKPLDIDKMLETLYNTAKAIVNENMVEEYRETLEKNNRELTVKNEKLQSLVRILDSKLLQIAKGEVKQIAEIDEQRDTISVEHLQELEELEIDLHGTSVLLNLSKKITSSNLQTVAELLLSYTKILNYYPLYSELSKNINNLADALNNAPDEFLQKVADISLPLESFIYVLSLWREKISQKEFSKSFEFHSSMINDIFSIIGTIDETHQNKLTKEFLDD